jgi:hypothetical protein
MVMKYFNQMSQFLSNSRPATLQNVYADLTELALSPQQVKSEKVVENIVAKYLKEKGYDDVHQQYNIGGYLGLKSDLDVGNGAVGIELKLASALQGSASNIQRTFGQAIYYSKRTYGQNLIFLIVGNAKIQNEPFMKEVISFLDSVGVAVLYVCTGKKEK